MKRVFIAAAVSALAFAVPSFAEDKPAQPPQGQGAVPDFKQQKSDELKSLDEMIATMREKRTCVKAAKTPSDLGICKQNVRAKLHEKAVESRAKARVGKSSPHGE